MSRVTRPPGFQLAPWLPPVRVCVCGEHMLAHDGSWRHATWTDSRPLPGRWPPCDRRYARAVERACDEWERRDLDAVQALYLAAIESGHA